LHAGTAETEVFMFKKIFCLCFSVIFALSLWIPAPAAQYTRLTTGGAAKVIEVIDGDSIKVRMINTGEIALVRLAGINAHAFDASFKYLNNSILGKTVYLDFPNYTPSYISGRWNNMLVSYNGESVNLKLVLLGYASVLDNYSDLDYDILYEMEWFAVSSGAGIWDTTVKYKNGYPYTSYGPGMPEVGFDKNAVNINTANPLVLKERLPDLPDSVISAILSYRAVNPFNTIYEVKFIPGFTRELFDKYKGRLAISTNINKANEEELKSLDWITPNEVSKILSFREKSTAIQPFASKTELYSRNLVSKGVFNAVENYIDIDTVLEIDLTYPVNKRFDLNTATRTQLAETGLTLRQADVIIAGRKRYSYKTVGELLRLPGLDLAPMDIYAYADNLMVSDGDYVNINFADIDTLILAGFTHSEANMIFSRRRRMLCADHIPIDISDSGNIAYSRVSLFTNINRASAGELLSLGIGKDAADAIIKARDKQPIGSLEELRDILNGVYPTGAYNYFEDIANFVTVL